MSKKTGILIAGSLGYDYVANAKSLPAKGETLLGDSFNTYLGGKGNNQAVGAARAGGQVSFLGHIGNDDVGPLLRDGLKNNKVSVEHLGVVDGRSGIAMIFTSDQGDNSIIVVLGANNTLDRAAIARKESAIAEAGYVLCQLETPMDGVIEAAKLSRKHGASFILDPAPAQSLPDELLRHTDWITPNETEAQTLLGFDPEIDLDKAARTLAAKGPRNVVLKLSSKGAYLLEEGKPGIMIPAFQVTQIDSTAAGDSFNGAFAVALSEGRSAPEAVRFASAAAAISVTRRGAQPSMPMRVEIEDMLKNGKVKA